MHCVMTKSNKKQKITDNTSNLSVENKPVHSSCVLPDLSPVSPGDIPWLHLVTKQDHRPKYSSSTREEYINPYSASGRWLKGCLHAHTCCGPELDMAETAKMYGLLGYDFIAVTDHNRTHPPEQIDKWSEESGITVLPGSENGGSDHIIEIGSYELTPELSDDYAERAAALRANNGFIIGCHPQEYRNGHENLHRGARFLHAFEIYNGLRECRGTDEERNVRLWDELLSSGERLWAVAADDFHWHYTGPARGWVQVQVPENKKITKDLLIEQMKKGAFYSTTYPLFELVEMGRGYLRIIADSRTKGISIIGPGGKVLEYSCGREMEWHMKTGLKYFRIELKSGVKTAWSQPFFNAATVDHNRKKPARKTGL